jgi:hypothetical protein
VAGLEDTDLVVGMGLVGRDLVVDMGSAVADKDS